VRILKKYNFKKWGNLIVEAVGLQYLSMGFIIIIIINAIKLSLCGSNPYTSIDKTNKNKYTYMKL
jgi:hypothetical protein